jgi:FkbM family methyltransferase
MKAKTLKFKDRLRLWVPYPVWAIIRRFIVNKTMGFIIATVFRDRIPHRGCILNTASPRITPTDKAALFFHLYERSEIDQVSAYIDKGSTVVEFGGSIGASSTQIIKNAGAHARVLIVEADEELCSINRMNLDKNFPTCDAIVINAAVDYTGSEEVLFVATDDSKTGRVLGPSDSVGEGTLVRVPVMTLGRIVAQHGLAQFILVCDIEGAEVGIFVKEDEVLRQCRRIIIEIDGGYLEGRYYSIDTLLQIAKERHFTVIHQHGNRFVLENSLLV